MTFQSIEFLIFFPIVFILYWTICKHNKTLQNCLLITSSLVFYSWWDYRFASLLLITAFSTFFAGYLMNKYDAVPKKRLIVSIVVIAINIGILFFYKYCNFFIESFTDAISLFGIKLATSTLNIILPVGISFYTFSALSYSIDVYQKKIEPTNDILAYLAYVTFFPGILSGPISRAQKQLPQYFNARTFDYNNAVNACFSILWGAVLKLCLADRLGIYVDTVYGNIVHHNGTTLLFTSVLYTIQIYADFAGYSLMAIGTGKLLGINLPTNFIRPYFANTITDFWRRWHISLTTWFRDYIYFPLGGNRCSKSRWILNTMIVFTVSGLWHGAAYTFLIWGMLHGAGMIIERIIYGEKIKSISNSFSIANLLRWGITFMFANFTWIFFRISNLNDVMIVFTKIFSDSGKLFMDPDTLLYAAMFFILVFIVDYINEYYSDKVKTLQDNNFIARWGIYISLTVAVLLFGVLDGGSFIYFQF